MNQPILLIEDEENDVLFMKRAMNQAGITLPLQVAPDGQAAVDLLKDALCDEHRSSSLPCLILLDLKLPRLMGLDVLKWIRRQPELQTTIVIVLTSSKMNSDIDASYRSGANSYLVKPGTPDQLLDIAKFIKEYWLHVNQLPSPCNAPTVQMA